MPQYLVAVYFPDNYDPSVETEATIEGIHALNREMIAAGVRKFACGLSRRATTLRAQPDGEVLVTDGPYLEARSTWVGYRYWRPQIRRRRWRGRGRARRRAALRSMCERFFSGRRPQRAEGYGNRNCRGTSSGVEQTLQFFRASGIHTHRVSMLRSGNE
jgi:hypothetical protein